MKRGEIWLVSFEPSVGTEIRKTRPALIISNNISNDYYSKVTLLPISSKLKDNEMLVAISPDQMNKMKSMSQVKIPDVTTFDKSRIKSKIGEISAKKLKEVEEKLRLHLAL